MKKAVLTFVSMVILMGAVGAALIDSPEDRVQETEQPGFVQLEKINGAGVEAYLSALGMAMDEAAD